MSTPGSTAAGPSGQVSIRPVAATDTDGLDAFYASLSPRSQRQRFLGYVPAVGVSNTRMFCMADHEHSEGFVAVAVADGRIMGHVCLVTDARGTTEFAIAVEDTAQRRGIGRRLFQAAVAWGQERHLERFTATAFADNAGMLRLADGGPRPPTRRALGGGVVRIDIPLRSD